MRLARIDLDQRDVAAAVAIPTVPGGDLPLNDRHLLLYVAGSESTLRHSLAHANAMARSLRHGIPIAVVSQSDFREALARLGLRCCDQVNAINLSSC